MKKINVEELKEIFIEIRNGNNLEFEKLYKKYNKLVYGIAFSILKNKQDAEDIVQIVFTKIYSIDKDKLPNKNEASWLYSITKNETINYLKRTNKNNNINIDNIYEIEDNNNEIDRIIDQDTYNRLISKLDDKEKEIISVKLLSDLSFEEIGKVLNVPTGTVKWRYYKSMHTLRILLSNLGMFIISFISSIIAFKNGTKKSNLIQEESDVEDNNFREEESDTEDNSLKKEEIKGSSLKENHTEEKKENTFLDDKEEQMEENVIIETPVQNNINYIGISFMGISAFFFIITMIFSIIFVKHQLKRRKKF